MRSKCGISVSNCWNISYFSHHLEGVRRKREKSVRFLAEPNVGAVFFHEDNIFFSAVLSFCSSITGL